jgi:hypothetical protein
MRPPLQPPPDRRPAEAALRTIAVTLLGLTLLASGAIQGANAASAASSGTSKADSSSTASPGPTSLDKTGDSTTKAPDVTFGAQPADPAGATPRALFDLLLSRGSITRDNLRVTNYSTKPLLLHVYAADASTAIDGGFIVADHNAVTRDIATWLHIGGLSSSGALKLAARTRIDLPFDISVPLSAQPGDHAGALVVSYVAVSHDSRGNAINVENRVATRVYARVAGVPRAGVTVTNLKASYQQSWIPWRQGRLRGSFVLHNTGNIRESMSALMTLAGLPGTNATSRPLGGPGDVLPGGAVLVSLPTQAIRPWLRDTVTIHAHAVEVAVGPGGPAPVFADGTARTTVHAVSWAALSAVLLLLLVLGGSALWWRRRRPGRPGGARRAGSDSGQPSTPALLEPVGFVIELPALARTRPRHAAFTLLVVSGLATALIGAGWAAQAEPASAAAHALYFAPSAGTGMTPAYVVTDSACPASSSNIVGRAYGHGFPASGQAVVNNSTAGVSHASPFVIPLEDTMNSFAQLNRTHLQGTYRITLTCTDRLQLHPSVVFAGTMTFNSRLHYTAAAPPASVVSAVQGAQSAANGSAGPATIAPATPPTAGAGSAGASGSNGSKTAPGETPTATGGARTDAGGAPAAVPLADSSTVHRGPIVSLPITLLGVALILFTAGLLVVDHRRRAARGAGNPTKGSS